MDYFLLRDARCNALIKDSIETAGKIDKYKINEALYKANEQDCESRVSVNKTLANNYKTTAIEFQAKYSKAQDKAKFRGKVLIGSLSVNLLFLVGGYFLIK